MFHDQLNAIELAKQWMMSPNDLVILDTETSGLGDDAEIIEISLINGNGKVLLDTLVKPTKEVPQEAIDIHGITNELLSTEKSWPEVQLDFENAIQGKALVIYNADYDMRIINQTYQAHQSTFPKDIENSITIDCAMLTYAEFSGIWDDRRENWKWHKLIDAAEKSGVKNDAAHRSLPDTIMTLGVIKYIAEQPGWEQFNEQ